MLYGYITSIKCLWTGYTPPFPHALFLYSWYSMFMWGIIWGMWTISCPPFVDRIKFSLLCSGHLDWINFWGQATGKQLVGWAVLFVVLGTGKKLVSCAVLLLFTLFLSWPNFVASTRWPGYVRIPSFHYPKNRGLLLCPNIIWAQEIVLSCLFVGGVEASGSGVGPIFHFSQWCFLGLLRRSLVCSDGQQPGAAHALLTTPKTCLVVLFLLLESWWQERLSRKLCY